MYVKIVEENGLTLEKDSYHDLVLVLVISQPLKVQIVRMILDRGVLPVSIRSRIMGQLGLGGQACGRRSRGRR